MTLKDIAKQLTTAVQTVPNLVQILRDGLEQATAGSSVEVTQVVSSGTKIASVKVDNETTDLYAPSAAHNYSTTEHVVGKWIDGTTDLYEKTVTFTDVSKNGSVSLGISSIDLIFMENGLYYSEGTYTPIPYVHTNSALNQGGFFLVEEDDSVTWNIRSGADAPSTINGFITFRYTKISS